MKNFCHGCHSCITACGEERPETSLPTTLMVDPPYGWKYGFPKELPSGVEFKDLLKSSGYPEKDIDFALKYSRFWEE